MSIKPGYSIADAAKTGRARNEHSVVQVNDPEAATNVEIARRSTYLGDYSRTAAALAPYILEAQGDCALNEHVLLQVEPASLRADLLVEIALLLNHYRRYAGAVDLLQRAINLCQSDADSYHKANAYHWLAFTK